MPRTASQRPDTVAIRLDHLDRTEAIPAIAARVAAAGGTVRTLSTVRRMDGETKLAEIELEVEGLDEASLVAALAGEPDVRAHRLTRSLDRVFGKRIIVIGGGAQVAQVALGAVSEADRHNLRVERISDAQATEGWNLASRGYVPHAVLMRRTARATLRPGRN